MVYTNRKVKPHRTQRTRYSAGLGIPLVRSRAERHTVLPSTASSSGNRLLEVGFGWQGDLYWGRFAFRDNRTKETAMLHRANVKTVTAACVAVVGVTVGVGAAESRFRSTAS